MTSTNASLDGTCRYRWLIVRLLMATLSAVIAGLAMLVLVHYAAAGAAEPVKDLVVAGTVVGCNPTVVTGSVRGQVSVEIYVTNAVDLYGADVRLSFSPTFAQVVDADPHATGVQIEVLSDFLKPDFVVRKTADNISGTIWYAATQVNPTLPVTGSGALARVTFLPQMTGTFTMPVTYQKLVRRNGTQIPATAQDCRITFKQLREIFLPMVLKTSPGLSVGDVEVR